MEIFPLYYGGNIAFYHALHASTAAVIDVHEHMIKQTLRNRMEILGPNGRQKLVVPTVKTGQRRPFNQVKISYSENWQKDHWKSLEAAYRRSPYFEYYEDQFRPFYQRKTELLVDLNSEMHAVICKIIGLELTIKFSTNYIECATADVDFRIRPFDYPTTDKYTQVFSDRFQFEPNLSALDLIFNVGPRAVDYINPAT